MKSITLSSIFALAFLATMPACTNGPGDIDSGDTDIVHETDEPDVELCDNGTDDDGDGLADCDDTDCADDAACEEVEAEICTDGIDNDGDSAIDCDDSDCAKDDACTAPVTEIDCENALDDDGDKMVDCDDDDCAGHLACDTVATEIDCADKIDNDKDSATDCADIDCELDLACAAPPVESGCADGIDDDKDGLTDCDDSDCDFDPACAAIVVETACGDSIDDDEDGLTDCEDDDCFTDARCMPESVCADGLDDDSDGRADCDDTDCAADVACESIEPTCSDLSLGSVTGTSIATGSTIGGGADVAGTCGGTDAEDVSYSWTAPGTATFAFTTLGSTYDSLLSLWSEDCSTEYECNDDYSGVSSGFVRDMTEGESVVIVVDGYSTRSGDYVLNVAATTEYDCANGDDDDADGATDCDDTECSDTLGCTHPCADDDLGTALGDSVATGTTVGGGDDATPTCLVSIGAEDIAYLWTAPADGTFTFDTLGSSYDTTLTIELGDCSGTELECNDDYSGTTSSVSTYLLEGEEIIVNVDGYSTRSGAYILNAWSESEVVCTDGLDEDLDGATDCDDEDCADDRACSGEESICDDALDDDVDGYQDCLDGDCSGDAVCDTSRADADLVSATGSPVATGSTVGMGNEWTPSCGYSPTAPEYTYAWVAPSTRSWSFSTLGSGYDTILGIYAYDGTALGCNDDSSGTTSLVTLSLDAGQLVIVSVDGYSAGAGAYSLSIY